MRYRERLNIIFMPDTGPRKSITMRRSRFYLLILFFTCMPFITLFLSLECWFLWHENTILRDNIEKFEYDYQNAEQRAERLENLESLLEEEKLAGREILLRQLAMYDKPVVEGADVEDERNLQQPGPGHEEFPAIDTGKVKVDNVQVRALRGNTLRVGLDIRNNNNERLISGEIVATLVTADGNKESLVFAPQGSSTFRINRYKRAVMNTHLPIKANLVNASIILEVKEQNGDILYQNIFDIQR